MRRRRGFTLLEVLATLTLLSIVLPVAMQGVTLAMQTADFARRKTEATALAETKLYELAAYGLQDATSGDFLSENRQYRWTAEVEYLETNLAVVEIEVTWESSRGAKSVSLATMVMIE